MKNFEFLPSGWTVVAILLIAALVAYLYWDRISTAGKTGWAKSSEKLGISGWLKKLEWDEIFTLKNVVWSVFFLFWGFMLVLLGIYMYHIAKAAKATPNDCGCGDFGIGIYYWILGIWTAIAFIGYFIEMFDSLWEGVKWYFGIAALLVLGTSIVILLIVSFKVGLQWCGSVAFSAVLATAFYRYEQEKNMSEAEKKKRKKQREEAWDW